MTMMKIKRQPQYSIWQWGKKLYTSSKSQCNKVKKRWKEQHGNIELEVLPETPEKEYKGWTLGRRIGTNETWWHNEHGHAECLPESKMGKEIAKILDI
jgi:hypothetical protein